MYLTTDLYKFNKYFFITQANLISRFSIEIKGIANTKKTIMLSVINKFYDCYKLFKTLGTGASTSFTQFFNFLSILSAILVSIVAKLFFSEISSFKLYNS